MSLEQKTLLPLDPSGTAEVSTIQNDGTRWIFYYNELNQLCYTSIGPNRETIHKAVDIGGHFLVGNRRVLAAARYDDSPRVYWIDTDRLLRELALVGTTGGTWEEGSLSTKKYEPYYDTALIAYGDRESLPSGVSLQGLFHEKEYYPKWTQLDHTGGTDWERQLLDW